jgi:hypothetical protein
MKKKSVYTLGIVSGLFLAGTWRVLAKEGIKIGIHAGRKAKELSQQVWEDIEDIAAEATAEVPEPAQENKDGGLEG